MPNVLHIRLPEYWHHRVRDIAKEDDRSLNSMIVRLVKEAINARDRQAVLEGEDS